MSRWRKRPMEVNAFQWTNKHGEDEDPEWILAAIKAGQVRGRQTSDGPRMEIYTPQGTMVAMPMDYIIQGASNEIYPCKQHVFEAIYERIE